MSKELNCAICGEKFIVVSPFNRKTCSTKCSFLLKKQITIKAQNKIVDRKCKNCNKIFLAKQGLYRKFCSMECQINFLKIDRLDKNNPNYKTGFKTGGKRTVEHMSACRVNRRLFLKEHKELFCEICGTKRSLRFESHHIVYASEAPMHKELHNRQNLIMLCIQCHNDLHAKKYLRNDLVIKRGLNELFGRNLLRYKKTINKI